MSDYMLLEYLKGRGKHNEDRELIEDFKHYMRAKKMRGSRRHKDYEWEDDYNRHDWGIDYSDYYRAKCKKLCFFFVQEVNFPMKGRILYYTTKRDNDSEKSLYL